MHVRIAGAAREFSRRVQVGPIGVNVAIPVPLAFHSFGGWKSSPFGDHHMRGPESVRFYARMKTVTSRWPTGMRAGADIAFVMTTDRIQSGCINIPLAADDGFVTMIAAPKTAASTEPVNTPILASAA